LITILFYIILIIAFTGNSLVDYNIIPKSFVLLTEGSVYLLFLGSLLASGKKRKNYNLDLIVPFILFVFAAFCSAIINNALSYLAIMSLRLVVRFYFLFLAFLNMRLEEKQLTKFNKFIMYMFIIQLPTQAIKFYFYGFSEDTIGTYGTHGGGLTTVIPLVALGYFFAYYSLYKKKLLYLILCAGFIAYGIIGLKLALLFLYPVSFIILYYLNVVKEKGIRIPGDIYKVTVIALLTAVVSVVIIKNQVRTNVGRQLGGKVNLSYALKSSLRYSTEMKSGDPDLAKGRIATTKMAVKFLLDDGFLTASFGYGPGIINKLRYSKKNIGYGNRTKAERIAGSYGLTGVVHIMTEYGFVGLVIIVYIYLMFVKSSWNLYKIEKSPYWKAFTSGSLFFSFVAFFIFAFYNTTTIIGGTILPVFYYCMSLVYIRKKSYSMELSKDNSI
jgi:hypothetical protein